VPIGVSLPSLVQLDVNLIPENSIIPQASAITPLNVEATSTVTASSTVSLIQSLYAEVQTLEAQIALLQAATPTTTPSTAPASPTTTCAPLVLTRNLAPGSKGSDVSALQQFLETQGYYAYPSITGYFGPVTEQAVEAFQSANGIESVGEVGPITSAKIATLTATCSMSTASTGTSSTSATTATTTATGVLPLTFGGGGEGGGGGPPAPTPDTTPPTVSLTAPSSGATVSGSSVTLTATASDNVAVANVQFKVGTTNIGSAITSSPYTSTWDSTGISDGTYTLYAVAEDTSGNYATTSESVTVDNLVPLSAGSADLYWVGGSGNWSDPHHWATSSGGTGEYDPPTTNNVVHFDSNSSANSYTVTFDSAASSATTTVANPGSGSPTFAGSAAWTDSGGLTLVSGMGWNYTGAMTFNATSLGKTITTAGVTLNNNITFNGTGGGWTDQDNLSDGSNDTITLTAGTWNTNAKTITTGIVNISGSTARAATFTNSTFDLTNNISDATTTANVVWNAGTVTNLTSALTGSTLNFQGYQQSMTPGTLTYPNVNYTGGGAAVIGSGTFGNLSITVPSAGPLPFDNTYTVGTWTVTGTLTLTGNSQVNRLGIIGSGARTLTAAAVSLTNVDFELITGAGAATWSGTSIGNLGGNSGITFTTPVTAYWVGGTGNWSDQADHWASSSGGTAGSAPLPLPQDSAIFDSNSFTAPGQTLTLDYQFYPATNFTGVANSPTIYFYVGGGFFGNLTLDPSMQATGDGALSIYQFNNRTGTSTLTTNGVSLPIELTMNGPGGALSLGSNLTLLSVGGTTGSMTVTAGTFTANNHNVTIASNFTSTGSTARAVTLGTGTWQIGATSGNAWNVTSTGMTLTSTGSTIKIDSSTPSGTRTFAGAGLTYNNLEWADEASTQGLTITGANTFNNFTVDPSASARTLTMPASTTYTATAFSLAGSATGQLSIVSSSPGTQATLSQSSGTVSGNYLTIQDSAATGGATFNTTNSVNVSNNSGWNFQ